MLYIYNSRGKKPACRGRPPQLTRPLRAHSVSQRRLPNPVRSAAVRRASPSCRLRRAGQSHAPDEPSDSHGPVRGRWEAHLRNPLPALPMGCQALRLYRESGSQRWSQRNPLSTRPQALGLQVPLQLGPLPSQRPAQPVPLPVSASGSPLPPAPMIPLK